MTFPLPTLTPGLLPYVLIAFIMVGANAYFIARLFPRNGGTPNLATIIVIFGLLIMSAGLWFSLLYAIVSPGDASTVSIFVAANSMMAVFGAWMIGVMLRAEEKHPSPTGWFWPSLFALLIVGNDLLMGVTFVLVQPGVYPWTLATGPGFVTLVADAVVSVWFFWAMLANMVVLLLWLPLPRAERRLLLGFSASTLVGPWVLASPIIGAVGMTAIMAVTLGFVFRELGEETFRSVRFLRVAAGVMGAFGLMAFAALAAFVGAGPNGNPVPFAVVTLAVMGSEVFLLARWAFRGSSRAEYAPGFLSPSAEQPVTTLSPES